MVDGKVKKIYSYHEQGSGVEGPLTFNQYEGDARPAFGLVQFDFDHAEDIALSHKDALGFINFLDVDTYHLSFSGSKGFHVAVPLECFGLEVSPQLPKILHDLAGYLVSFFPTMDVKVYNANRKFRILNTRHAKTGLYKTLINKTMSLDEIREYCKERSDKWYSELQVSGTASSLIAAIDESKRQHAYDKEKAGTELEQTSFEAYAEKACIKRLLEESCGEGGRNNTALVLAHDFHKVGKTKSFAVERLSKWAHDNNFELSELLPIIDRAYSGGQYYNHGCLDSVKSAKCSHKCGIYDKVAPGKKVIPVDAPKSVYKAAEKAEGDAKKIKARELIYTYLREHIISIDLADVWYENGKITDQSDVANRIYVAAFNNKKGVESCSFVTINAFLEIWARDERDKLLADLRKHIKYDGVESDELEKWLKAVSDTADEVDLAIMKHFIWQVKRKILEMPVYDHIMPVICGVTKTGKSEAVRILTSSLLEAVTTESDLKRVGDSREDFLLIRSYVMFLDEMAKSQSADVETLKSKITAKIIEYRKLGMNITVRGRQNASFIGTSNHRLVEIIKDPTSARRYYEIWVSKRCDWSAVNGIDYLKLWRSIDENTDSFIREYADKISDRQDLIRARDNVEEWLEYFDLKPDHKGKDIDVSSWDLFTDYLNYMEDQNKKNWAVSHTQFGLKMASHCTKSRGKKGVVYSVSSNYRAGLRPSVTSSPRDGVAVEGRSVINF